MRIFLAIAIVIQSLFGFSQENLNAFSREKFNSNWKFERFGQHPEKPGIIIPEPEGIEKKAYNDAAWRNLNLPHDWGIEGPFRDDLVNETGLLPWRGIGWYRKHFIVSENDKGKQIFIDFDGAMANAKVWLNGKFVGEWPYGYTSFRFNLTPYIQFGKENVIAVRLDTEKYDSRWYPGAGLYRNVWLTKTNAVHIDHWGIYLTTPKVTKKEAHVNLQVNLKNNRSQVSNIYLQTIIYNSENKEVAKSKKMASSLPAQSKKTIALEIMVENPSLWSIENPNLYTAQTSVYEGDKIIHKEITTFGFRTIEFTAKEGFLLNGKKIEIKGVCNHHDLGPLGAKFNTRAAERQLEILKEIGCNSIRTSHNPPAPELLDLCDKMGFLVQVEAFDTWQTAKKENDYNIHFDAWHVEDIKAMVLRDRNHPSVFMWSIGNEIPDQSNPVLAKRLADIIRMMDHSRPVTAGCNWPVSAYNGFLDALDVFGYNYNHWSYEKFFGDSTLLDVPFVANETTSCLSTRGEYFFPVVNGPADDNLPGKGIFHMSSYDMQYPGWGLSPDMQFKYNEQYPRIMGEYVWTGFDYLGEPTPYFRDITDLVNYTDSAEIKALRKRLNGLGTDEIPSRSSYFGIIDLCGFKKDRFYIYQAKWRPDFPMAHILPHWNWPERMGKNVPVHVYSSGDEAELFLNGKSLGKRKKAQFEYRFQWDDVVYQPGELKVKVWKDGKVWAEDVMKTSLNAAKMNLTIDRKEITADGEDLVFVTVDILDKNNQFVPRAYNKINFEIEGPGEIIAVCNGDPTSHEPFIATDQSAFNGKCLAIIRGTKEGTIKLKVKSKGLKNSSIEIKVTK
ncbi:MAG: beta-galactosidase GalB [Bacteroidales bacterium]|nr:beta-galactosidase GalB [Bacteroidales bacterium]MDY0216354.1 beta-galactosidase GalB [Bacteroidales bacterium]